VADAQKNILLVAYSCRPGLTSEREVGWKWASLISTRDRVTVLTRLSNKPHIEAWIERGEAVNRNLEFIYFDLPAWATVWKKGERGLYAYYVLWSFFAILKARRAHRKCPFDITHFLTFGTILWPQFAFLMPTRYVLGPVGGGERIPFALRRAFDWKGRVQLVVRRLAQMGQYVNPVFWLNVCRADRILVRTRETWDLIPSFLRAKTELLLETGVPEAMLDRPATPSEHRQLTIVTVGRLIPTKISRLTLEAVSDFKAAYGSRFRFVIVGDGPQRAHLEQVKAELGLEEVEFTGWLSSPDVLKQLESSDIYFSTTMKEAGSWAFFEAVTCRLPVVCLRVNGPDMIIGDGCGVKVAPSSYDAAKRELRDGLLALARSPELRTELAAKEMAYLLENFSWRNVLARIQRVYDEVSLPAPPTGRWSSHQPGRLQ